MRYLFVLFALLIASPVYGGGWAVDSDGQVKTGKTARLVGDAIAWDDIQSPLLSVRIPASGDTPPDLAQHQGNFWYCFDGGSTETVYLTAQLPHSYSEGSDVCLHIHGFPVGATPADNVSISADISWTNADSAVASATTYSATFALDGVQYGHQFEEVAILSGTGKEISSILAVTLERPGGADSNNEDFCIMYGDFHFRKDGFGSREELLK